MVRAVVDRFEGQFAVLIVDGQSERVDVPRDLLPRGTREGDYLQVEFQDGHLLPNAETPADYDDASRALLLSAANRPKSVSTGYGKVRFS